MFNSLVVVKENEDSVNRYYFLWALTTQDGGRRKEAGDDDDDDDDLIGKLILFLFIYFNQQFITWSTVANHSRLNLLSVLEKSVQ